MAALSAAGAATARGRTGPARPAVAPPADLAAEPLISAPPSYKLVITLPSTDDDQKAIDIMLALHRLLKRHPGPDPVTLRIPYSPETGHLTSARLPEGVSYSPRLEDEICDLLGPDALAVIRLV